MRYRTHLLFVALLLLGQSLASAQTISIAAARALPLGTVVTVQGTVTVPSGTYTSSTFDQGFAIQDGTAGIYVSTVDDNGLNIYHRARVTGTLGDDGFGVLVLRPASAADVVRLHLPGLVLPAAKETGDISKATEGLLVEVEGVVTRPVVDDRPFGFQVFIDDGSGETQVFIAASTGINPLELRWIRPGRRIHAIGFSSQFLAQYEVLPRFRFDIRRAF